MVPEEYPATLRTRLDQFLVGSEMGQAAAHTFPRPSHKCSIGLNNVHVNGHKLDIFRICCEYLSRSIGKHNLCQILVLIQILTGAFQSATSLMRPNLYCIMRSSTGVAIFLTWSGMNMPSMTSNDLPGRGCKGRKPFSHMTLPYARLLTWCCHKWLIRYWTINNGLCPLKPS